MRSHLLVILTALSPLVATVTGCNSGTGSSAQSLTARCTSTIALSTSELVTVGGGSGTGSGSGSDAGTSSGSGTGSGSDAGTSSGSGTGSGSDAGLPTSPTDCPVCRDASGNPLSPDKCVVHDEVCVGVSGNPGGSAAQVTQTLTVVQAATASPAIAYYGACDGNGKTCEQRDFAYQLTGNEVAVATFTSGTTVYAIPAGATAVKASQPIFPLLPASAFFHNPGVHVVFRDQAGNTVDAYGDMQNDCRVVADSGSQPPSNVPCWCTQC
jgi:hypothetical protein